MLLGRYQAHKLSMTNNPKMQRHTQKSRAQRKRASKLPKTVLALFVTLLPIVLLAFSMVSALNDPRQVTPLAPIVSSTEPIKLFQEPLLSITFDDGSESVYSKAAPILHKYGIPTTQYIISGSLKDRNYLSAAQIRALDAAGHDIQSHTVSHADLVALDDEDIARELKQSREELSKLLGHQVTDFASPLNRYDQRVVDTIKQHYRSHRNTVADINNASDKNFNIANSFTPYDIIGFSVRTNTKPEQIQRYIDTAKQKNAWIVLIYHEVNPDSKSYYNVKPDQFEAQMKTVRDSAIRTTTVGQALDAYFSSQGTN